MRENRPIRLRIVTAEGYADTAAILQHISEGDMPQDAVCIYPGTRNQLYTLPTRHGLLVVKCFRTPNAINSIAYTTVRSGKACRSYLNSLRMKRLGISVPEPIAYAEQRKGIKMRRSYYLSRAVEGDTIRFYEMRPDCDRMLRALAREMLHMHLAGVWHKDFSPGNIIVDRREDGSYTFNYVDLNRMAFDTTDHRKQLRMFERINYTEMHTVRLARAYASLIPTTDPFRNDLRHILTTAPEDTAHRPDPLQGLYPVQCPDPLQGLYPIQGSDPLQGLYPMLRRDALIWRGEDYIVAGAIEAFRHFWHTRNRKNRLLHPFRRHS